MYYDMIINKLESMEKEWQESNKKLEKSFDNYIKVMEEARDEIIERINLLYSKEEIASMREEHLVADARGAGQSARLTDMD